MLSRVAAMGSARLAGAMVGAMLVGSGNVVKNGINSSMGQVFGSTVIATTFGVTGAMLTCLLLEGLGAGRSRETAPWREAWAAVRPWMLVGGALGAVSVGSQTFLIGPIGAVLLHVIQLSTELFLAMIVDSIGCLGLKRRQVTVVRVLGVIISMLGAVATVGDFVGQTERAGAGPEHPAIGRAAQEPEPENQAEGLVLAAYLSLAVLVGCCRPIQTVLNGGLKQALQSPVRAATVSITVSLLLLLLLSALQLAFLPQLRPLFADAMSNDTQLELWMATSGPMSTYSVVAPVVLAPIISLSGFSGASMTGQLFTSLLIDHIGWLSWRRPMTAMRLGGVGVVLAGALLVRWSDARSAARVARAASDAGDGGKADERARLIKSGEGEGDDDGED